MRSGFQSKTRGKGIPNRGVNEAAQTPDRMHLVQAGQTQIVVVSAGGSRGPVVSTELQSITENQQCLHTSRHFSAFLRYSFFGLCLLSHDRKMVAEALTPHLPTNMSKAGRKGRPDSREFYFYLLSPSSIANTPS